MEHDLIIFRARSPQELKERLILLSEDQKAAARLAEVRVCGSSILVRQFEFPIMPSAMLKQALRLEAAETLSLLPEEIEIDYRLFNSVTDKKAGLFTAISSKAVQEYLACFEGTGLIPVRITANSIAVAQDFLTQQKNLKNNFCLLHFTGKNVVNLAMFIGSEYLLLREIEYDSFTDAQQEIIDSLKYLLGRSAYKQLDALYFSGDTSGKSELIGILQSTVELNTQEKTEPGLKPEELMFSFLSGINLLKRMAISLNTRNRILAWTNTSLIICAGLSIALLINMLITQNRIRSISSSFSMQDYEYARKLQQSLK